MVLVITQWGLCWGLETLCNCTALKCAQDLQLQGAKQDSQWHLKWQTSWQLRWAQDISLNQNQRKWETAQSLRESNFSRLKRLIQIIWKKNSTEEAGRIRKCQGKTHYLCDYFKRPVALKPVIYSQHFYYFFQGRLVQGQQSRSCILLDSLIEFILALNTMLQTFLQWLQKSLTHTHTKNCFILSLSCRFLFPWSNLTKMIVLT